MIFDGILKTVRGIVKLRGGTDNTIIGNLSNRLLVNAAIDPRLTVQTLPLAIQFLNGAASNMNVDGSVTPVNYSVAPAASVTYFITSISLLLDDNGTNSATNFGALATLTNGFLLRSSISSVTYDIISVTTNAGLMLAYTENKILPITNNKWLNSGDWYSGQLKFEVPFKLTGDNGDFIRFVVRDNLSGLNFLRAIAHGWMVI